MSISTENVVTVLEEGKKVETRWYVQAPLNYDRYDVFVIRYTYRIVEGFAESECYREYLCEEGKWIHMEEGEMIKPCLVLRGYLVHMMVQTGVFERAFVEDELQRLANRVFRGNVVSPEKTE